MLERRKMLLTVAVSGLVLGAAAACDEKVKKVGAVENLMREHGVIRRAILVYRADTVVFPAWKKALSGISLPSLSGEVARQSATEGASP